MNISNDKRPRNHDIDPNGLVSQDACLQETLEPELDFELCEKFGSLLEPRLEVLVDEHADFVTADSLRRSLRRR